jgi:hypothetical protein
MAIDLKGTIQDETKWVLILCCLYFLVFILNNWWTIPVHAGADGNPRRVINTGFVVGTELAFDHGQGTLHAPEPYGDGVVPGDILAYDFKNTFKDKSLHGLTFALLLGVSSFHLVFFTQYNQIYSSLDKNDPKRDMVNTLSITHLIIGIVGLLISCYSFLYVTDLNATNLDIPAAGAYHDAPNTQNITQKIQFTIRLSIGNLFFNITTFIYFLFFIFYFQPKLY